MNNKAEETVHLRKCGPTPGSDALVCGDDIKGKLHVDVLDVEKVTCTKCRDIVLHGTVRSQGHGLRRG